MKGILHIQQELGVKSRLYSGWLVFKGCVFGYKERITLLIIAELIVQIIGS